MTKKASAPDSVAGPMEHVVPWLRRQVGLPIEAMAGFVQHVGAGCWDTAEHWLIRWDQWFHGTGPSRR